MQRQAGQQPERGQNIKGLRSPAVMPCHKDTPSMLVAAAANR
jgi:hypothetical protein